MFSTSVISVKIRNQEIHEVLLDGGSGVNVITEAERCRLGLPEPTPAHFKLRMADSSLVQPTGLLHDVTISIHGISYTIILTVISCKDVNSAYTLLLGRPWLRAARVIHNWANDHIQIMGNGKMHTIHINRQVGFEANSQAALVCYNHVEDITKGGESILGKAEEFAHPRTTVIRTSEPPGTHSYPVQTTGHLTLISPSVSPLLEKNMSVTEVSNWTNEAVEKQSQADVHLRNSQVPTSIYIGTTVPTCQLGTKKALVHRVKTGFGESHPNSGGIPDFTTDILDFTPNSSAHQTRYRRNLHPPSSENRQTPSEKPDLFPNQEILGTAPSNIPAPPLYDCVSGTQWVFFYAAPLLTPPSLITHSFISSRLPLPIYPPAAMTSLPTSALSPSRLVLRLRPPSPSYSSIPHFRTPRSVAVSFQQLSGRTTFRPRRIARFRNLPSRSLIALRVKKKESHRVRFCRMAKQKQLAMPARVQATDTPITGTWRTIISHPMTHMAKWREYAAQSSFELDWVRQVGLRGYLNLPWTTTPIRTDVVERFINTASIDTEGIIIGQVYGEIYTITADTITQTLKLPAGSTDLVNTNPDPAEYDYYTGTEDAISIVPTLHDGWSVSKGPGELKHRKYGILQGMFFKRKQTYTSHNCILLFLTLEELAKNGTGSWNWSNMMLQQLQTEIQTLQSGKSNQCYSAEVWDMLLRQTKGRRQQPTVPSPTPTARLRRNSLPNITAPNPTPSTEPRRQSLPMTDPTPDAPYTGPGSRTRSRTQPDPSPAIPKRKPGTSTYMAVDMALQEFGRGRPRQRPSTPQAESSSSTQLSPLIRRRTRQTNPVPAISAPPPTPNQPVPTATTSPPVIPYPTTTTSTPASPAPVPATHTTPTTGLPSPPNTIDRTLLLSSPTHQVPNTSVPAIYYRPPRTLQQNIAIFRSSTTQLLQILDNVSVQAQSTSETQRREEALQYTLAATERRVTELVEQFNTATADLHQCQTEVTHLRQ